MVSIERISYFDFLRGTAILYIVGIRHLDDYANNFYNNAIDNIITYVFLGLFVFFISGYFLGIKGNIHSRSDVFRFFKGRFLKLYPPFLVALITFCLSGLISFADVIRHMFFLNIFFGNSVITLWFIGMIFIYYILFPILTFQYRFTKSFFLFLGICILIIVGRKVFNLSIDKRLLIYLPLFYIGILTAKHKMIDIYTKKPTIFVSTVIFFVTAYCYVQEDNFKHLLQISFMVFSMPVILFFGNVISQYISNILIEFVSYSSYFIFLFHRVVFVLLLQLYTPNNEILIVLYLSFVGMAVIFLISYYGQKYYDFYLNFLYTRKKLYQ